MLILIQEKKVRRDKHKVFYLGIKALIRDESGRILLLLKNPKGLGNLNINEEKRQVYWDLPGGRIQNGSSTEETLQRELREEIGLGKFENRGMVGAAVSNIDNKKNGNGLILFVYNCEPVGGFEVKISDEDREHGWFTSEEAVEKLRVNYPEDFLRKLI